MDPNWFNFFNFNPFMQYPQPENSQNQQDPQYFPNSDSPQFFNMPNYDPNEYFIGGFNFAFHPYHQNKSPGGYMSQLSVEQSPQIPSSGWVSLQYPDYSTENIEEDNTTPFLFGKSIEEIKKDAAIEKKQHAELKAAAERSDSLSISAVSSSLGPQPLSTNTQESPGLRVLTQPQESPGLRVLTQPSTKDTQIGSSNNLHSSTLNKGNSPIVDEFKYGFPSEGLSSLSFRWWGNKSDDNGADSQQSGSEDAEKRKQQPKDSLDTAAISPSVDEEVTEGKKNKRDSNSQWARSLSALRKKAAKEGKQALKLGVYRGDGVKALDRTKKKVLLQIFNSSLPSEWADISSES